MTTATNETGGMMGGNQTNQTGGGNQTQQGPLEQLGEALGGITYSNDVFQTKFSLLLKNISLSNTFLQ